MLYIHVYNSNLYYVSEIYDYTRDRKFSNFYFVRNFDKSPSGKPAPKPITETSEVDEPNLEFKTITPHGVKGSRAQGMLQGAVSGVVGNFVGITRVVRQHLLPDKQLLEVGGGRGVGGWGEKRGWVEGEAWVGGGRGVVGWCERRGWVE